jgi:hypothetical protein
VILLDKLLIGGIGWVLRRVADAANAEEADEGSLREELLAAEMRLELGEIDEGEFRMLEEGILERMRAARGRRAPSETTRSGMRYAVESIEANVGGEGQTERPTAARRRRKRVGARRRG